MGYAVYITRASTHTEGSRTPIGRDEWRALIVEDPELEVPDPAVPDFALFLGRSRLEEPWMDLEDGNVYTNSPDEAVFRKLIALAERLGARVEGEDGEGYHLEGDRVECSHRAAADDIDAGASAGTASGRAVGRERATGETGVDRIFETERLEDLLDRALPLGMVGGAGSSASAPAGRSVPELPGDAVDSGDAAEEPGEGHPEGGYEPGYVQPPGTVLRRPPGGGPSRETGYHFEVGQSVRTRWGRRATVISINPRADGGLGRIDIRYHDGTTASMSLASSGLVPG